MYRQTLDTQQIALSSAGHRFGPTGDRRVDVVEKTFYPVSGGVQTNVLETYSVLAEKGWRVNVHTSKNDYLRKNVLPERDFIRGLNIRRYTCGAFGFFPKIDWANTDAVCLHNFVMFPHLWILLYVAWLKFLGRKQFSLFITPHGGFTPIWSVFPLWQRIIKRTYHETLGRLLMNFVADGVRAVSEWEKQILIKKGVKPELIEVIGNGLEETAFVDIEAEASDEVRKTVESLGRYLIQIGRLHPVKNFETVIRALPLLPKDVKFVMVGPVHDEAYKAQLDELVEQLGVKDRVVYLGVVRGADKYYLIRNAELMVHMARWESFCNVVHEGMSQGRVCVVADKYALPYLVKDGVNGFCLDVEDHQSVAEKIQYVLDNKGNGQITKMMGVNKQQAAGHTWRSVAEKMEHFYHSRLAV